METRRTVGLDLMLAKRSDTKYRDIADGNVPIWTTSIKWSFKSDTKYRDIADGNVQACPLDFFLTGVRYQVPRYSGWKPFAHLHIGKDE